MFFQRAKLLQGDFIKYDICQVL